MVIAQVILRMLRAYGTSDPPDQVATYPLTVPKDPEIGVTTADDQGCW